MSDLTPESPRLDAEAPDQRRWKWFACILWALPMLVIAVMVGLRPERRTLTPLYAAAAQAWRAHTSIYWGPAGMNYLPTFVVLYQPFDAVGLVLGGILWRFLAAGGLAAALWRLARGFDARSTPRSFCIASAVALPLMLPALQNGQANAHLGMAIALAAASLVERRWSFAAACLAVAISIKPLGIAPAGLAFIIYPQLRWRLLAAVAAVLLIPFALGPGQYVCDQYRMCWENLRQCAEVSEHRFADLNGLLRAFGVPLTGGASLLVRAGSGLGFAALCWLLRGRIAEPHRTWAWHGFGAAYLMLFNPMTEANSYVILAPALGVGSVLAFAGGNRALGGAFAAMGLSMGLLPNLLRPLFGNAFALAWHPSMTLVFSVILTALVLGGRSPLRVEPSQTPAGS